MGGGGGFGTPANVGSSSVDGSLVRADSVGSPPRPVVTAARGFKSYALALGGSVERTTIGGDFICRSADSIASFVGFHDSNSRESASLCAGLIEEREQPGHTPNKITLTIVTLRSSRDMLLDIIAFASARAAEPNPGIGFPIDPHSRGRHGAWRRPHWFAH